MRIDACFDSHVHWPFTGEFHQRLKLGNLPAPDDIRKIKILPQFMRGEWLIGFGWNDNLWKERPHRETLDAWFPTGPVALSRCDGHAVWANTEALKRAGLWDLNKEIPGGRIERDATGSPTGVLIERAGEIVLEKVPRPETFELRRNMLKGIQVFNEAGYTHIRDMTCDEAQWNEAVKLDNAGLLTMAVEEYFWLKDFAHLDSTIDLAKRARSSQTPNLRSKGLKVFLDGALGSEGAYLSRCYHGKDHRGLLLWGEDHLQTVLKRAWENELEVAVHVIGDEAGDRLIQVARELKEKGTQGALHLEHCELLRAETIANMKGLNVECHIQPSHWLSDRVWLKEKLGDLSETAFQWRKLQEAEIAFDFGSDAPIEPASISRVFQALRESSEAGVPRLLGNAGSYMGHKDLAWAPNSYTLLEEEVPHQVVFRGEHLI